MTIAGSTKDIMRRHTVTASKRFGQNFLKEPAVLEDIVKASGVSSEDIVVEIGPGIGALTELLAEKARRVIAVEVDRSLIPVLEETLSHCENVEIINQDIMKTDLSALTDGAPFRVVANLPYYITTPIIMSLLESDLPILSVTVMVQKEVGERMVAPPGNKSYGALTLAVEYRTEARIVRNVGKGCFIPEPSVDSVVVHMDVYRERPVEAKDGKLLFRLIRAAFNQRRKTLVNALSGSPDLGFSKDRIREVLEELGEKPTVRGEELSLSRFAALSDALTS